MAGCDGFLGDEVADLPEAAWGIFAVLLARWHARAEVPAVWQSIKQVHLVKPDAKLTPKGRFAGSTGS